MSRARFRDTKRYLHLTGSTALPPGDKMVEMKPFSDLTSARFQQFGVFSKFLSVVE